VVAARRAGLLEPATAPMSAPTTRTVLWLVPGVYFVFVAAEFAAMTHLALQATAAGRSALAVGLLATALWSGILLSSLRAHAFVQRWGHGAVFVGATVLSLLATLSLALHAQFALWCAGVFVLGLGGGLVWVAGEAWLAESAPPDRRGFFVGLFETAVGLGLMTGPALVPLSRWMQWSPLWLSALLMALALLASLRLRGVATADAGASAAADGPAAAELAMARASAWRAVALPLAGIAVVSGLMESGVSSLMPSISMRLGFTLDAAAWLGAVIGAGSALLQPPAGHLADRWGVRRAALTAWALVALANVVLLWWASEPATVLWGVGFVLGGVGGAVYTLMIVELGHRLGGVALVKAIALLVTGYALGTAIGPVLGGIVFDAAGLRGLALLLLLLALVGWGVTRRSLRPAAASAAITPAGV